MSTYCRLCAEERDRSDIITTINDSSRLIEQKLIACCQWDPQTTEDKLPQDVCVFCLDKLEKCWMFRQSVKEAQHKIRDLIENVPRKRVSKKPAKPAKQAKPTFECLDCLNTFSSRLALERHECTTTPQIFQCDLCNKIFKNNDSLRGHEKNKGKYKCIPCGLSFCRDRALIDHKHQSCTVTNMGMVVADEAEEEIESKPTFVDCSLEMEIEHEHKLEIDPESEAPEEELLISYENSSECTIEQEKEYQCHLCNRGFKKFPLLKYHMFVHTLPRKYKCQFCNSKFRTERHYTSHQKNHVDYYCDTCHKKFPSAFALKVHCRMHVGASVKMYGCAECDHFFVDVSTYYNHMRRRHGLDTVAAKQKAILIKPNGTAKPFVCEQCGKDFLERSSLKAHALVHLDIRPWECELCPKTFKNKYNLKTHQETHSGEKSVQCNQCGKRYSRKSILLKHMEEHTGVFTRTYPCDFCDRVFRSLYNMQNHRRTHTGEKPFRCDVCNHDVTTKSQLDRHLKTISHIAKYNEAMGIHHDSEMV